LVLNVRVEVSNPVGDATLVNNLNFGFVFSFLCCYRRIWVWLPVKFTRTVLV